MRYLYVKTPASMSEKTESSVGLFEYYAYDFSQP